MILKTLLITALLMLNLLNGQDHLVGGFSNSDKTQCQKPIDDFLKMHQHGELIFFEYEVKSCESQVVAGMNYKMTLEIYGQDCEVTIYRNLRNELKINENNTNSCFIIQEAESN